MKFIYDNGVYRQAAESDFNAIESLGIDDAPIFLSPEQRISDCEAQIEALTKGYRTGVDNS